MSGNGAPRPPQRRRRPEPTSRAGEVVQAVSYGVGLVVVGLLGLLVVGGLLLGVKAVWEALL